MHIAVTRARLEADVYSQVFHGLALAVVVVDDTGAVLTCNDAARELLGALVHSPGVRCCDLVSCGRGEATRPLAYHCVTAAVLEHGRPLRGLEAPLPGGRRVDITAVPLGGGAGAILQLHPGDGATTPSATLPPLQISTLGEFRLTRGGTGIGDGWLHQRSGTLLKYLLCARGHQVPADELVESLWPDSGRAGLVSLRQAVHSLRDRLEPGRARQAPSRFIVARAGGYQLDAGNVLVDADVFEREAHAALLAAGRAGRRNAQAELAAAARRYGGDFLPDDPYAEWALGERDRLRSLAARVLRELAESHLEAEELPPASSALERLADLEPLDLGNQRDLIALMLRRGQHAAAARRYELVRREFRRTFGEDLDFTLRDLLAATAGEPYSVAAVGGRSNMTRPR